MMKYLTLFVIIASALRLVDASPITSDGFKLNTRERSARKLSDVDQDNKDTDLRQWNEEDYEAIMSVMSGQKNLRHRILQKNDSEYKKKPYYTSQQTTVRGWQKYALGFFGTSMVLLALYVCHLKNELSHLNQYIPLGYKLFPDSEPEEEQLPGGVQMS